MTVWGFASNSAFASISPQMPTPYEIPVSKLAGVGPARLKALNSLGVNTVQDLLGVLPRTYELKSRKPISALKTGDQALVVGQLLRLKISGPPGRQRLEIVLKDGTGFLKLIFFQPRSVAYLKDLKTMTELTVSGPVTSFNSVHQIAHPKIALGNKAREWEGIWPIYPELKNIKPGDLGRLAEVALDFIRKQRPTEQFDSDTLRKLNLLPLFESYEAIHQPKALFASTEKHPAFRRMAFEEIYQFQLRLQKHRKAQQNSKAPVLPVVDAKKLFEQIMPFSPTGAQARVIQEITQDFTRPMPMLRLLQGDVGSGKTAVAASAALHMKEFGYQTALMAPTEILAEQHHQLFAELFGESKVARLKGSLKTKARRQALEKVKTGEAQIVVGTHALFSTDVEYQRLGLCIIDEQHRFGVEQRTALRNKGRDGDKVPHILAMTATPIPRSLALTAYGDFALSVLDELPPGRTPISTHVLKGDPIQNIGMLADKCFRNNEQAYIIYPLVEESEKLDLLDAETGFKHLVSLFGDSQVALVHGRMTADEKGLAMQRFSSGQVRFLVSTTVVEVGVDVPNATYMIIIHPERFGLSQLHQLRGRVGRGSRKSACYLLSDKFFLGDEAYRRLSIMEKTQDGFKIAAEDLAIRGPGDFLGTRQSGLPIFHHCDLVKHADLIEPARELAISLSP
ncbi:MAG: ATP-dependent DNA helicase RecG [Deltaproteobacteria bacterium]|nr:ATP-dependent DNA helicase RecG [Deltaproteobacteria bacterium]